MRVYQLGRGDLYRKLRSMMPLDVQASWPDDPPPIGSTMHHILRAILGLIEEARRDAKKES